MVCRLLLALLFATPAFAGGLQWHDGTQIAGRRARSRVWLLRSRN